MPRAGLSEAPPGLLRSAVVNEQTEQRYRAKTRPMLGSSCLRWTGAVSARGHGRIWLGESDGRDVVVIAHRFAWALEFAAARLRQPAARQARVSGTGPHHQGPAKAACAVMPGAIALPAASVMYGSPKSS